MDVQGDVFNSGTIAGRQAVVLNAENVEILNGRIQANQVGLNTSKDLNIIGGQIQADQAVDLNVGRNFNLESSTQHSENKIGESTFTYTGLDRVAGVYTKAPKEIKSIDTENLKTSISIRVGGDTTLKAAEIQNNNGSTIIQTQGNLNIGGITTEINNRGYADQNNYNYSKKQQDVGSVIQSVADTRLQAENIAVKGSQVSSEQGSTILSAQQDIDISEGRNVAEIEQAAQFSSKGVLSSKVEQKRIHKLNDEAIASTIDGRKVILDANNIKIQGSQVVSDELNQIQAKENVSIIGAENKYLNETAQNVKKSGLMSSDGIGFSVGKKTEITEQQNTQITNTSSMVGSLQGDTNIIAGKNYQQTGSTVSSQKGDVNILAQQVNIEAAKEQSSSQYKHEMEQKGLTLAVNVPVVSTVETAIDSVKQVGQSKNDRVNAMAAANAGFDSYKAGQSLKQLADVASDLNNAGKVEVGVSLTYGQQKNTEFNRSESTTASQSTVSAGGKTNIVATGAGKDSNINIIGSDVMGLKGTHLAADQDVNIKAAEQNSKEESGNKSAGWNAGVTVSNQTGFGVTAGGNLGKGKGNGESTSYVNSHVGSKDSQTSISSGNATNIIGGQVQGKAVQVDAKELNIESLQDKATYKSKQQNISGQVSVGTNGGNASGSFSKSNINANHASVSEQSGIFAGDEGYQIKVKDNTDLKGAIITSTQLAETQNKNSLSTGTLTHSELRNVSEYDAKGISVGAGFNAGATNSKGEKQADTVLSKPNKIDGHASSQVGVSKSIGFGLDSDQDSSVTKSGVNTKNITITNESGQQQLTGKTAEQIKSEILTDVTTDTARENSGALNNVFDKDKVQKEINLQMDVTKKFDANRQEAKSEINKQIDELKAAGKDASQWQKAGVLLDMVSAGLSAPTASGAGIAASTLSPAVSYEIGQYFKGKDAEGSTAHILAHTILGAAVAATGGNNALTAGIAAGGAEATAPLLSQYLYGKDAKDLTASEKSTISSIVGLAGTAVGAITGDVSSTVQSGQSAQNAVENNKTSYKQDLKKAILCWNAKCQQEYKDMEARQKAAYRKGQNQAISKFAEDIKNLPNVPQELYDALRNDPQGTTIAILNGIFAIPGEIINTGVTITKGNLVGSSTSDFEKLGQAEMSATLNTLSGFLSAGAVTVAKKGGKIVLGLKADFDPNLNVQVNGITSKSTGNIVELKAGSKGDWNKLANKPEANTTYKFENGYTYKTDANGRVSSVQADLKLEANDRNGYQQKVSGRTDRKPDDHGGHLIASMFKGPGEGINIVPMDKAFNGSGGEWYKLETDWKKALEGNKSVKVNIQPVYSGNSKRPDSFIITQSVDSGKPRTLTLKNTATGK